MHECFAACINIWMPHSCWVLVEVRRGCQNHNWSYRGLRATMRILKTKSWFSRRADSAVNGWAIFLATSPFKIYLLLCVLCGYFACIHTDVPLVCLVPMEARRWRQIYWDRSYTIWMPRIKSRSSRKTASAPGHWAISLLAPICHLLVFLFAYF